MDINDTAIPLGSDSGLIQNLGPDNLFVGGSDVTAETGLQVAAGQALTIGVLRNGIYGVSDGTADVRVLDRGQGLFSTPSAPAEEPE